MWSWLLAAYASYLLLSGDKGEDGAKSLSFGLSAIRILAVKRQPTRWY